MSGAAADRLADAVNIAAAAIAESNFDEGMPSNLEILSGRDTADLISPTKKTKDGPQVAKRAE